MTRQSTGRQLMDSARAFFRAVQAEELRLLALREATATRTETRLQLVTILGILLSVVVSFTVAWRLSMHSAAHARHAEEVEERIAILTAERDALEQELRNS